LPKQRGAGPSQASSGEKARGRRKCTVGVKSEGREGTRGSEKSASSGKVSFFVDQEIRKIGQIYVRGIGAKEMKLFSPSVPGKRPRAQGKQP